MTENAEKIRELVEEIAKKQGLIDKEDKALLKTLDDNILRELKYNIDSAKRDAQKILAEDLDAAYEYFENSDFYKENHDLLNEAQAVIFADDSSPLTGTIERVVSVYVILAMQNLKQAQNGISFINDNQEDKTVIYNPEKLYKKFMEASKDYLIPNISKIVNRENFEKALLKGLQNE